MTSTKEGTRRRNVLLFPYGSEISNEVVRALVHNKHFHLIRATSDDALLSAAQGDEVHYLPYVTSSEFEAALHRLIIEREISFVIPAHDDVALIISNMEMPGQCKVVGQKYETNRIVRHKKATYQSLSSVIPVPNIFTELEKIEYPVFVKPDRGQGSKQALLVSDRISLDAYLKGRDPGDFVFSENLLGDEYTVDCFSDRGNLRFAGPRTRERTINGISSLSRTLASGARRIELLDMAEKISAHFEMHGLWFFQAKADGQGTLRLLEVATRVSGTMMANRAKGINFVELALWQSLGHPIELAPKPDTIVVRRTLEPHYEFDKSYERLLVDFDDTLLVQGSLNIALLALVFTAKNLGKPIILITKNQNRALSVTLHQFGISAIFNEIIHLGAEDQKSDFVGKGDLLVDDSYSERAAASRAGAKAISLDMIEMYLDR